MLGLHFKNRFTGTSLPVIILSFTILQPLLLEAQGRINLPQMEKSVAIPDNCHTVLVDFFGVIDSDTSIVLNTTVEQILLDILPEEYRSGCREMILHWGTVAYGTATMSVRVLFYTTTGEDEISHVLMVYRCFSLYEGYRDQFYDERLASLTIKPAGSSLIMLPHAKDGNNLSDLSHITLNRVVQCAGVPMICLRIESSNDNPCCGGPYNYSEILLNYYIQDSTEFKLVASVIKHREDYYHDDVEGDLDVIYDAKITLQKDQNGNISSIVSHYSVRENEELRETGEYTYIWNKADREYKQVGE